MQAKRKRKIETKKRSAPKIQLLSNKAERWKHPAVNTAFKREVDRQRKEREAYQDIDTIENEVDTPKTKKEGILRSPSRLDEEKRKEVLSSIRTRLLYNRFDWNSHGRFVPAHRPFNPRMYGNGKCMCLRHLHRPRAGDHRALWPIPLRRAGRVYVVRHHRQHQHALSSIIVPSRVIFYFW